MKKISFFGFVCLATLAFVQPNRSDADCQHHKHNVAHAKQDHATPVKTAPVAAPAPAKVAPAVRSNPEVVPLYNIDTEAHKAPAAGSRLAKILSSQVLRVCVRSDVPPFGYLHKGSLTGFDVALARLINRKLSIYYKKNLHISWKVISAKARIASLENNYCDLVVATFSVTAERAKRVAFSKAYYNTDKVVLAKNSTTSNKPVIAMTAGTTLPDNAPKGVFSAFTDYNEIIFAMNTSEIHYVIADRPTAQHMMNSVSGSYKITQTLGKSESYAVAVNKDSGDLLEAINRILESLAHAGELAYLQRQWL